MHRHTYGDGYDFKYNGIVHRNTCINSKECVEQMNVLFNDKDYRTVKITTDKGIDNPSIYKILRDIITF